MSVHPAIAASTRGISGRGILPETMPPSARSIARSAWRLADLVVGTAPLTEGQALLQRHERFAPAQEAIDPEHPVLAFHPVDELGGRRAEARDVLAARERLLDPQHAGRHVHAGRLLAVALARPVEVLGREADERRGHAAARDHAQLELFVVRALAGDGRGRRQLLRALQNVRANTACEWLRSTPASRYRAAKYSSDVRRGGPRWLFGAF